MESIENIQKQFKLTIWAKVTIVIALLLFTFSFIAPWLFTKIPNNTGFDLDFTGTGAVGDTIGGIMNPIITGSGVLLTFLAFYIQYKANKTQFLLFRYELDNQKIQEQKKNIESLFFEMLDFHKSNANEIQLTLTRKFSENLKTVYKEEIITGRSVFSHFLNEFEFAFELAKIHFPDTKKEKLINEAYAVFFLGITKEMKSKHQFFRDLEKIQNYYKCDSYQYLNSIAKKVLSHNWNIDLNFNIFSGHSDALAHYYRHLFQTVKFIANQKESLLSYEDKRKYLRILRAQLSNSEQVMLFYNWLSDFGIAWENEDNKFFTDYRMIHNLYNELLLDDFKLEDMFKDRVDFRKERDRHFDPLFEFEDWDRTKESTLH